MKKNLLEVCFSPDLGGLELYMVRCAKALNSEFNVTSIINPLGKLEQYYKGSEYKYRLIKKSSNILMFSAARKLSKIIDELGIDIIHIHWTKDIPIAVLAKKLSSKDVQIAQTRNMTMTRFKDDFYHRFLYKNIDLMLPVTFQVAEQIKKFVPQEIRPKVEVLYMGSEKVKLLNEEEVLAQRSELGMSDSFCVGLVGRIEEVKGQYLLIEAIQMLVEKGLNVKAYFVGHAMHESYLQELKAKVEDKNLQNSVVFVGFLKNPFHFMQICNVIVMATKCETFGLVLSEAMHTKTAVIGANACGALEIIDDNENGLLFENQNSNSLHEKIELLIKSETMTNKIAESGFMKANEKFNSALQFEKLAKIFEELIS
ncbi:MAG: glycosyltransferase [Helicobacteraceae bacterium]|nr:glycosyltransferase [Helicobacteraceae bacterium]